MTLALLSHSDGVNKLNLERRALTNSKKGLS